MDLANRTRSHPCDFARFITSARPGGTTRRMPKVRGFGTSGLARCGRELMTSFGRAGDERSKNYACNKVSTLVNQGCLPFGGPAAKSLKKLVPRGGIEPPTHGFSVRCSTN